VVSRSEFKITSISEFDEIAKREEIFFWHFIAEEKQQMPTTIKPIFYEKNPDWLILGRLQKKSISFNFPTVLVHSANPIGSANIMGYVNNFFMNEAQPQTCVRVNIPHFIKDEN